MKKFVRVFILLLCSGISYGAFGQGELSISQITGGVSGSPVSGGTQGIAVFGIQVDKAAAAQSDITDLTIQLDADPSGKFTNPRLYVSGNNNFNIAFDNLVGGLTITTNATSFNFAGPITTFGGNSTAETRYYFIVVDVDPTADGTTPTITPSISEVDITTATSVVANSFSGTTYSFTGITPNITSVGPGSTTCVGETITINGTGFSSPTVTINGITASINSSNTTQIQITAPGGGAIGTFPIVVTNANTNSDNSSNYTIKAAINSGISVSSDNPNPIPNEAFNILVGGATQAGVSYRVRRISPTTGGFSTAQNGNGGVLSFGPYSHNPPTPTMYIYEVEAQSTGCGNVTLLQTATVTIAAILADAGPATADVCSGDGMVLGGSPAVSGGTGFYMVSWTSSPPGFTSTATNPLVTPTVTTTYTITVTDSNGDSDTDNIIVTVNDRTDPDDLDIVLTPAQNTYSTEDDAVDLSFTVSGGSGTGTFSGDGVNSTTDKFFPNAANVGSNDISLTFVNTDNCETTITETVEVYDPNGFISGLEQLYCPEGTDNLTVNIPPGYLSFVNIILYNPSFIEIPAGSGWTKNIATRQVQINLTQLPIGRNYFRIQYTRTGIIGYNYTPYFDISCFCIKYTVTPIYGPVPAYVYVPLVIKAAPVATIGFKTPSTNFCKSAEIVDLVGSPVGGIWQGAGVAADGSNDLFPDFNPGDNGLATFDPATAAVGNNLIRYIFRDADGCRDTATVVFNVYDIPTLSFTAPNGCVGEDVEFTPSVNTPAGVTISNYFWDFGDDRSVFFPALQNPTIHVYSSSQDYDVSFNAVTTDKCVATYTQTISVGDVPDLALTWRGVCENEISDLEIISDFFTNTLSLVNRLEWDFGDGTSFIRNKPAINPSHAIIPHNYAATGYYTARATLTSTLGCTRTDSLAVYKVPFIDAIDAKIYAEDFDDASFEMQGWKTGGTNTSWDWATPAGTLINNTPAVGSAWITNPSGSYNESEKSWVHSPCFDLSSIERPVISFDYQSYIREQLDGVVLQINSSNTTDDETAWKNVGIIGAGKNWFNTTGIFANPGNQTLLQSGWSGKQIGTNWIEGIFALDGELPAFPNMRKKIRFRFAFASLERTSSTSVLPEGFAFDNVKIGERDRIVLLETFTNSGGSNSPTDPNRSFNENVNATFLGETELIKVEYHLGIGGPGTDLLFLDNKQDANARAAYYGVTATPFAFLDSKNGNLGTIFEEQKLVSADVSIDTIITHPSIGDSIRVAFTTKNDLPANTVLHIVPVEKLITDVVGANGETNFRYVMKQMLPDATGTKFSSPISAGTEDTVTVYWPPVAYNQNELAVIAFFQNEENREIFQAKILSNPTYIPPVNIITEVEQEFINKIMVFPNPANEELTIQLPALLPQSAPVKLYDSFGREQYISSFESNELTKTISTKNLAAGMYILQLDSKEGPLLRKKVLVIH